MNTLKPQLNQSSYKHRFQFRKFCNFCVCVSFLTLFVCLIALTLRAEEVETEEHPPPTNTAEIQTTEDTVEQDSTAEDTEATPPERRKK